MSIKIENSGAGYTEVTIGDVVFTIFEEGCIGVDVINDGTDDLISKPDFKLLLSIIKPFLTKGE